MRYMLEGSVRKANNRTDHRAAGGHRRAITCGLSVTTGIYRTSLPCKRRSPGGSRGAVRLTMEEEKHMGRPYTSSEVAWEYFMRGAELYRRFTPKDNAHARELFEKAIDLDPEFVRRMRIWLPPIDKIGSWHGLRTVKPQRSWRIVWRTRRLSWQASSSPSLRCPMRSNNGLCSLVQKATSGGQRCGRGGGPSAIPTTRMAMPCGRTC